MSSLSLAKLINDGAPYVCGFNFTLYGLDRCQRNSVGAITQAAYDQARSDSPLVKHLFLHGTAVCETHARVLAEDFGLTDNGVTIHHP